jgi:DNA excision repair protein ERCC-2
MSHYLDLFPYRPRPIQSELMGLVFGGIASGGSVLAEAGSGSGKTVCALVPAVHEGGRAGKRVLYLTRTNSQQVQVFRELRAISARSPVLGTGIQGRHSTCLLMGNEKEWRHASPDELSLLCNDRKEAARRHDPRGCMFFHKLLETGTGELLEYARRELPTVEEMARECGRLGVCPYEASKLLLKQAQVVVAPYIFLLSPFIRARLLDWMNCPLEDIVVVVDESHNLPEFARALRSVSLGMQTIRIASQEAADLGGLYVLEEVQAPEFCGALERIILGLKEEYIIDEDGIVPPGEVEEELMYSFKWTSNKLEMAVANIAAHGEVIRENRRRAGRIPRSYLHSVGSFLALWMGVESDAYVKLIKDDGDGPRLEAYCMDPSLASEPLRRCHAGIHMSGTLAPLEEYRDSLGLSGPISMRSFPPGFPPHNRLILFDGSVSMKYEERLMDADMFSGILAKAEAVCRATSRNTAVFFPSHDMLELSLARDFAGAVGRKVFIEERGLPQQELIETIDLFKEEGRRGGDGAVLLSVIGGRVSEGIDFPDRELEVAVLVGIPYPKPTAKQKALQYYYDIKFGKGWDYTVKAPTARRMLQAIGRLIRSEHDRGVAVILDRRAAQFKEYLPDLKETTDPAKDVAAFWSSAESRPQK